MPRTKKTATKEETTRKDAVVKVETVKASSKKADGKITLSVSFNGETFNTKTDDVKEALLALKPEVIKSKVIIEASANGRTTKQMLFPARAKLIFRNDIAAEVMAKNIKLLLNAK